MTDPIEILTVTEMAQADRLTIAAGTSGLQLMEAAGAAVALACVRHLAEGRRTRVLVLCGPGNNGGDGFVAARHLGRLGHDVDVRCLGDVGAYRDDARLALDAWGGPVGDTATADFGAADLVVDALFGAGLSRPLDGAAGQLVERINASRRPVVSVDVPSGVDGDSGRVMGCAVRALETVTFFRRKPAHYLLPGRTLCGTVTRAEIGIEDAVLDEIAPRTIANTPEAWGAAFPRPSPDGHKYSRGHLVVVSGAMPTLGAARLAAGGAARIGAGLVTVASPDDALAAHAAHLTSIMLRPFDGAAGLAEILSDSRKSVVVLGPGLGVGPRTRALVETALTPAPDGKRRCVVLDADALTSFADDAAALAGLIGGCTGPVVATPHDGEFLRLFGRDGDLGSSSKLVRVRAAARLLGAVTLLKGDDSVVASPDGRASIAVGNAPWLATAGSGDVLAGMIGGLLSQAMPAFEATSAAVYLHAAAARDFGPGLIAEDLPDLLPKALRTLFDGLFRSMIDL